MASNGLVANAKKTVFMILDMTKSECESKIADNIIIDNVSVERSKSTKLLGVTIDEKHNWKEHFSGSDGLINALNKRTFIIRRIKNQLPKKNIMQIVQALWMSKLRYGLQLCNQVRVKASDSLNSNMKAVQVAQNKMLRMLEGISLKEHITSISLLQKHNIPSVNQLAGEIKLIEAWKSINIPKYPFKMESFNPNKEQGERRMRPNTTKIWKDSARSKAASESISIDSAKLWNLAPKEVKDAQTLWSAKSAIKKYCKTLEI